MAAPTLNFITFNQDHSCLAVGKYFDPIIGPRSLVLAYAD
jgi:hypothetical protein